ncbi:hypothetical protein B0T20DRAFT_424610 [Sordaria brevicollis]|uniref:Uncharacterized protein n=1 Tax=Sordaria brevicollis TaxID=83679 RepID=A0AAE0U2S3_SORBR|nr:hypothetical protein B0T20DRAFT_424610 [Sordaria brevicollis]
MKASSWDFLACFFCLICSFCLIFWTTFLRSKTPFRCFFSNFFVCLTFLTMMGDWLGDVMSPVWSNWC